MVKYLAGSQPSFPREDLFAIMPPHSPFVQVSHTGNCYHVTTSNVTVHGGTHAYVTVYKKKRLINVPLQLYLYQPPVPVHEEGLTYGNRQAMRVAPITALLIKYAVCL